MPIIRNGYCRLLGPSLGTRCDNCQPYKMCFKICVFCFFSIKTTNLTLCCAVLLLESPDWVWENMDSPSVNEAWYQVRNDVFGHSNKTPTILWVDLQKWGYNWHQCRLSLRDLQPLQADTLVVKRLFWLPTSQMNCLYCKICLIFLCAEIIIFLALPDF